MPYFGGKQRIADRIVDMFPPHGHYVEPFAGGLSVLFAKPPARLETVNDLDGDIVNFWRVLREQPEDLIRACALTPHSRAEHASSRDRECLDDLERARRVWVGLTQGRSGQLMRTGWRNYI
ncbi:MAG: DNA methyltransferase, partial [Phenylobacterium zucineum]